MSETTIPKDLLPLYNSCAAEGLAADHVIRNLIERIGRAEFSFAELMKASEEAAEWIRSPEAYFQFQRSIHLAKEGSRG